MCHLSCVSFKVVLSSYNIFAYSSNTFIEAILGTQIELGYMLRYLDISKTHTQAVS